MRDVGNDALTDQEVFNTVARHLLKQGAPARDRHGNACFRNVAGQKCAIGVLIPDGEYRVWMEDYTPETLVRELSRLASVDRKLIRMLRLTHDTWPSNQWRLHLAWIAARFGLDAEVLNEFS